MRQNYDSTMAQKQIVARAQKPSLTNLRLVQKLLKPLFYLYLTCVITTVTHNPHFLVLQVTMVTRLLGA